MNFYKLMNEFRCDKSEKEYTHVSMFPYGGLYKIPEYKLEEFYDAYQSYLTDGLKLGILERPKDIGPMVVDVDISKKANEITSLYTHSDIMSYVRCFQRILRELTESELLECIVLEKPAYMNRGHCKNGFHLHFPSMWMSRAQRSLITRFVKEYLGSDNIDSSAVRNNWFLYGSRKSEGQDPYTYSFTVNNRGVEEYGLKSPLSSILIRKLSIRNNEEGHVTHILPEIWEHNKPRPKPKPKDETPDIGVICDTDLIDRCMKSLSSSRANDYNDWIRVGCILHTIDPIGGLERWRKFSMKSAKYDEDYLDTTWSRLREYDYSIGSLVYLAKLDDPRFTTTTRGPTVRLLSNVVIKYNVKQLRAKCKDRGIKSISTMSKDKMCDMLGIPRSPKDMKYEKSCKGHMKKARMVSLTEISSGEVSVFSSIYSAAKSIGRNPGSIHLKNDTDKTLESKVDDREYKIHIHM